MIFQGPGPGSECSRQSGSMPAVLSVGLVPLLGELGIVEPKLTFGHFFDFRFRVEPGRFFNLPHSFQALRDLRNSGLSPRYMLLPFSVRCRPARHALLNSLQLRLF